MKIETGKRYKNLATGKIVRVIRLSKDGDTVYLDNDNFINKEVFNHYYKRCDTDDRVNHPSYYQDPSGVECITVARHRDFNIGNALKYLWRAGLKTEAGLSNKEKTIEDLNKAIWYIKDEIKMLQNDKGKNSGTAESND
jgi:hypothetical protein